MTPPIGNRVTTPPFGAMSLRGRHCLKLVAGAYPLDQPWALGLKPWALRRSPVKRIERKHLKEDELAHSLRMAREFVQPRQSALKTVGIVAAILIVAGVGFGVWREWNE